jgi:hypothetical protein
MTATTNKETWPTNTWTNDQLSDFELAVDLIGTMYAIVWNRIWKQRAEREPDALSLAGLQRVLTQCERDRRLLRWHKEDRIAMRAIIDQYTVSVRRELSMH